MSGPILPRRLSHYHPRLRIAIEKSRYLVKSVENAGELEKVLRLRHEVYFGELLGKKKSPGFDADAFDPICDHMMIVEKTNRQVIGTYRLNASTFNHRFYSGKEFSIGKILALAGNKLEIGRACVHRDFRNGAVFSLLWRGVLDYAARIKARYLFGCSSIPTMDPVKAAAIHRYLSEKHPAAPEMQVSPRWFRRVPGFSRLKNFFQTQSLDELSALSKKNEGPMEGTSGHPLEGLVSELLRFYLRAGAVICGPPALDREFRCIDFFTLIDLQKVGSRARNHFQIGS